MRSGDEMINPHVFSGDIYVEFNLSGPSILTLATRLLDEFNIDKSQVFFTATIKEV